MVREKRRQKEGEGFSVVSRERKIKKKKKERRKDYWWNLKVSFHFLSFISNTE